MRRLSASLVLISVLLVGCPSTEDPPPEACAERQDAGACVPAYEPTFANVFEQTLKPSCGKGGAACHTTRARQGGLAFEEIEDAYKGLQTGKLKPGNATCSTLFVRLAATDPNVRMPPGRALPEAEQCAIRQWIDNGAAR